MSNNPTFSPDTDKSGMPPPYSQPPSYAPPQVIMLPAIAAAIQCKLTSRNRKYIFCNARILLDQWFLKCGPWPISEPRRQYFSVGHRVGMCLKENYSDSPSNEYSRHYSADSESENLRRQNMNSKLGEDQKKKVITSVEVLISTQTRIKSKKRSK